MFKKVIAILSAAAVIAALGAGCSKQGGVADESTTEDSVEVVSVIEDLNVQTQGNLVTKTQKNSDGTVNVNYIDEKGNVVETFKLDGSDVLEHKSKTFEEGGKVASEQSYSPDGKLISAENYRYDDTGAVEERRFSEYDSGRLTVSTYYDGEGNVTQYVQPSYDEQGRLQKIENLDKDKKVTGYFVYEYGDNNRVAKYSRFDSAGKLLSYTEFTYDEADNLVKESTFDAAGKSTGYYEYTYYASGQRKTSTYYGADGKILTSDTFEEETQAQQ